MNRRNFLQGSGLAIGAAVTLPTLSCSSPAAGETEIESYENWTSIRKQFNLAPDRIHMSQMLLASHPLPVRRAIEMHRKYLDENPAEYEGDSFFRIDRDGQVSNAAAQYMGVDPTEVALTDSTTMGLAMLYSGLKLKAEDEVLTTTHDHYSTERSLHFATQKTGARLNRISLYDEPSQASVSEIIKRLTSAITPSTKIIAVTWVHSSTGVKLPIGEMAKAISEVNNSRGPDQRIYFCVDGVHGFGNQDVTIEELGCDFLAAGTHKWIFGPRGTGILYGRKDAWDIIEPIIPAFSLTAYGHWLGMFVDQPLTFQNNFSPGGFHSFEHRWALKEAFEFQLNIGKQRVMERTQNLSSLLKEGLQHISHVMLHTPVDPSLSAGINCFEIDGLLPDDFVTKMAAHGIVASSSPYKTSYCRLTPSIVNTEEEVKRCIEVIEKIKG